MMIATASTPGERETIIEIWADQRRSLLVTVDGISEDEARATGPVGTLTLGGLIKHLALFEEYWIAAILAADPEAEFDVDLEERYRMADDETFTDWLDRYRRQAQLTEEFVATVPDLDAVIPIPVAPWAPVRQHHTVRRILLHMFRETAHHSGHADLIRESFDGQSTTKTLAADAIRSYERG